MDQLTSSIAGQLIPPEAVQPQGTPALLPPADLAEDNMDMGMLEKEKDQDDVAMGDGNGAHESERTENGVAKKA